ncbi:DJ-1/PfpI family protein [Saccharospirillum mangrovi]|uniref:DJ-1/PfpI family protein n=1 Tax=Saccharospirillum mangrovi TaxID=2161747 RepID=UPI000D37024E|nr:DJ-1/PfpI family protein [Saccharospirillum mangrovi]
MSIGIFIYDQAEVLDFSGPFEVFSTAIRLGGDANRLTPYLISEDSKPVTARAGFRVQPNFTLDQHPALDALLVVGGVHTEVMHRQPVLDWLIEQADEVSILASVCTGAFVLAQAGLLDGRRVTTHWEDQTDLQRQFPSLTVVDKVRWIDAGDRLTSGGISAGIDMSLHLVERLAGRDLAERTARQMEFHWLENPTG